VIASHSRSIGVLALVMLGAVLVALGRPGPVAACQVAGWELADVGRLAMVIVEADVTSADQGGVYDLHVRRSLRGSSAGTTLTIGESWTNDCLGWLGLTVGDHIIIALSDPETARSSETAVWWIDADGSTISGISMMPFDRDWTRVEVLAQLGSLPDTATDDNTEPGESWLPSLLGVLFLVAVLASWQVFPTGRRGNPATPASISTP
jgi:hypothetical protein